MDNRVVSIRTGRRNAFRDKIIKRLYTTIRDVQKKMLSVERGLKGDRKYDDLVRLNYRSRDAIRDIAFAISKRGETTCCSLFYLPPLSSVVIIVCAD